MASAPASIAGFDPRSQEYLLDPQAAVQGLLRRAPVFFHAPLNAYVVLRYGDVRSVIDDAATYSSHTFKTTPVRADLRARIPVEWEHAGQVIQGGQLTNIDPPAHTAQRRAMQQMFTHKRVATARPAMAEISDDVIDGLVDRGRCDLMQDFAMQMTIRVIAGMIDIPRDQLPGFLAWIGDVLGLLAPIDLRPEDVTVPDDQLVRTYEQVHSAYLVYAAMVAERRTHPGTDLASAMLAITDDDGRLALTDDQVLGHMLGLVAAGTDTTSMLIVNMVRLFTEHPDQLGRVLDDPSLWANAVREGLRRSSVSTHAMRISLRDTEIAGVRIPAGSKLLLSLAAANADPAKFPDPLRFDVRRENAAEHVALGRGRHFCLGAPLAPPEAQIALEVLYRRLPGLRADLGQTLEFKPSPVARVVVSQQVSW